jgi:integrase/recombinase XerD
MQSLFEQFLKERRLLKNISPKTENYYRQALIAFVRYSGESLDSLSSGKLNKWIVAMLEAEVKPVSCNTYISAMNAFFNWCFENEITPKRFKADILKIEEKGFKTLSESQLWQIASYKPETSSEWRTHTITSLLIDTGLRIEEALSLLIANVNFEDALITIKGKGGKDRTIPISFEMRKRLWVYFHKKRIKNPSSYVFNTRTCGRVEYHNFRRDLLMLCEKLKLGEVRIHPHGFRHFYAVNFLRKGGDLFRLSKILGHTSIQTTQIYLRSMGIEALQEIHQQLSPLTKS